LLSSSTATRCYGQTTSLKEAMMSINVIHTKPDLRVEFEPDDHFFRLGDPDRYANRNTFTSCDVKP